MERLKPLAGRQARHARERDGQVSGSGQAGRTVRGKSTLPLARPCKVAALSPVQMTSSQNKKSKGKKANTHIKHQVLLWRSPALGPSDNNKMGENAVLPRPYEYAVSKAVTAKWRRRL